MKWVRDHHMNSSLRERQARAAFLNRLMSRPGAPEDVISKVSPLLNSFLKMVNAWMKRKKN